MDVASYAASQKTLRPPSEWISREEGSELHRLDLAFADELARVDGRAADLLRESDPRTALEALPDWETFLGLPDPCIGELDTIEERRAAATAKYTDLGGQSIAYFEAYAAAFGFEIEIVEYIPARCGVAVCGDAIWGDEWKHTWTVRVSEFSVTVAKAGAAVCTDPLRSWQNGALECVIEAAKPAHTRVLFEYVVQAVESTDEGGHRGRLPAEWDGDMPARDAGGSAIDVDVIERAVPVLLAGGGGGSMTVVVTL